MTSPGQTTEMLDGTLVVPPHPATTSSATMAAPPVTHRFDRSRLFRTSAAYGTPMPDTPPGPAPGTRLFAVLRRDDSNLESRVWRAASLAFRGLGSGTFGGLTDGIRRNVEPTPGFEPGTFSLPRKCS